MLALHDSDAGRHVFVDAEGLDQLRRAAPDGAGDTLADERLTDGGLSRFDGVPVYLGECPCRPTPAPAK